jgi:hypothetical protein
VAYFFRQQHHKPFVSGALMAPIGEAFVKQVGEFAKAHGIPVVLFEKRQRKDDVAKEHLARFPGREGVLFIGKAQEKTSVFRTQRRRDATTGMAYPWLYRSTAMVNQVYFYCVDEDFGPFFLKYSTYFPRSFFRACTPASCARASRISCRQPRRVTTLSGLISSGWRPQS